MGTTPTYALPYPELSDQANVPADMKELADGVDAALGAVAPMPPAWAHFQRTAAQTIPHNVVTAFLPALAEVDGVGWSVSGAGDITVPSAGVYLVTAIMTWKASSGTGFRFVYIQKNTSVTMTRAASIGAASIDASTMAVRTLRLAASDKIRVSIFQTSGVSIDLDSAFASGVDVTRLSY